MTFLQIQTRFLALVDESAITSTHKSHINYAIKDIINAFPFSWDLTSTDLTLAAGTSNLPSTYNPKWRIYDARITASSTSDDNIFTEIDPKDRDRYGSSDYVYWITNNAGTFVFNTPTQTGTVTIYYYTLPTDLSGDSDACVVPDAEAVALMAASKHFLGEDQDDKLREMYQKEAGSRIKEMYSQDLNFGPKVYESSIVSSNDSLTTRGV
jgi:hypothetical protein